MPVPMVGRADALDELRHAWERVRGSGRCVPAVLTGLPGTGKSTLASAAVQVTSPDLILWGSARVHTPAPYDWLAAVLASTSPRPGLPVPPQALAWLAQDPDVPRERYTPDALLRLAVTTVRALVGGLPSVLVVEDLHALDPASLNLVAELAGAELPALLVVTSRPPDVAVNPTLTVRTLERLAGAPGSVRRHLGALGQQDVRTIIQHVYAQHLPATETGSANGSAPRPAAAGAGSATDGGCAVDLELLAGAAWRHTGGNPYRLTELLAMAGTPEALAEHLSLDRPGRDSSDRPGRDTSDRPGQAHFDRPAGRESFARPGRDGFDRPVGREPVELTAREREVLGCLAEGMANKQIARVLGISVRTVTVHVSNLLRKTGASSRTEAALWAVRTAPAVPTQRAAGGEDEVRAAVTP